MRRKRKFDQEQVIDEDFSKQRGFPIPVSVPHPDPFRLPLENVYLTHKQAASNDQTKKTKMKPSFTTSQQQERGPRKLSSNLIELTKLIVLILTLSFQIRSTITLSYGQQQAWPTAGGQSIAGLQQSMAQMLQVFNGNDSNQLELNHFKLLERDGSDFILVGARNIVYNLSLSTMREQRRLEWPSSEDDIKMCRVKGKSSEQCQNYIRVLKLQPPDSLIVCGTNAYRPRCRTYLITSNAYELVTETSGEGACPYQENQNVTSLLVDGELYSATAAQFSGIDGLIHRPPLRTEQFNPKQLNSPNFVNSFKYGEHVYFLFRESAIEYTNCGKIIYSRIGRVCANDMGGNRGNKERFTSFVKARLNCSIPGEYPFYFDEIQASTSVISSSLNQDLLYAVFTTPTNSIGGSAVCAFRMADVEAVFEAGPFKAQADSNSNWLPVPEGNVPQPKPGTCVNNSKRLPDENVNFLKDNSLMDSAVEAIWSQPIIMMASINFRFTQIVVDPQVETLQAFGAQSMRTDVIFVSTDDGRVFKLINTHHLIAKQNNQLMAQSNQPFYMPAPAASATGQARLRAGQFLDPAPSSAFPSNQKPPTAASLIGQTYQAQAVREPLPDISAQTIVIEELHLFDSRTPILGLQIHHSPKDYSKLIILSGKQLKAVPLSRCERALSCLDCVALYDPYCAWNFHQQLCQNVGRSANSAAGLFAHNQRAPNQPANGWFSANNLNQANNHTIAWWQQCPAQSVAASEQANQQVGLPFRSLFSSHLQVPSRFDYASNHHLSHTALVSLVTPNLVSNHQASPVIRQPQPVSECLTYCGGLYTPHQQQNQQQQSQHQQLASAGYGQLGGQEQSQSSQLMMNCADFVQQHYIGNLQSSGFPPNFNANNNNLYYTSENLYLAVIICAVSGIILGLAFGFALGRNSRKHDSSICSSTFDETNLYMASTGSHHGAVASNLFAPQQVPLNRPHLPIQASSSHLYSNGLAGLIAPNGTQNNAAAGGLNTNSRSNGLLLQQQQLRL